MMTEMTRYKQQRNVEDDLSSLGSARTEDLSVGNTRVRYHLGSNWWRSRTALERILLLGWVLLLVTVIILAGSLHVHSQTPHVVVLHSNMTATYGTVPGGYPMVPRPGRPGGPSSIGPGGTCMSSYCVMVAGRVLSSMDLTMDPCQDFYRYTCGGWIDSNPTPDGKAAWGTLNKLSADNQVILRRALESEDDPKSDAERKAQVFYRSCLDKNNTIQKRKAQPLLDLMDTLGVGFKVWGDDISTKYDYETDIINSKIKMSSDALFSWGVAEDDKISSQNIIQFEQGGLTLSSRDMYLNETEKAVANAYVEYVAKIGVLLGASTSKARAVAESIMSVEKRIANITEPPERHRDVKRLYNKMTLKNLTDLAPFMDWQKFVNAAFGKIDKKLNSSTEVVVYAKDFLKSISNLVVELKGSREGKKSLHYYLTWQSIQNYINILSDDFRDAAKVLTEAEEGVSGEEANWRQCVTATDAAVGPALGAMYVRRAFRDKSKEQVEVMLQGIREKFRYSLKTVEWMDDKTRKAALEKADSITEMIGYPDYILNPKDLDKKFKDLKLTEDDFFGNNIRVTEMKVKESLERYFKPVNKSRWDMTPPTVNAYYSPTRNDIVFPAGILQPPFFWNKNPHSLNYGAAGVVMGHELAHAFDDQGRDYDKNGNMAPWWQPETSRRFKNQTQCMEEQYSQYTVSDEHINGKLTLGENIADNGGLKASYRAYQKWVEQAGEELPLPGIDLNHYQLFFVGFSQVWCSTMTKERAHLEIKKDPHVPAKFRVLGTLSNFPEFAKQFNCPLGSNMNPEHKCSVW